MSEIARQSIGGFTEAHRASIDQLAASTTSPLHEAARQSVAGMLDQLAASTTSPLHEAARQSVAGMLDQLAAEHRASIDRIAGSVNAFPRDILAQVANSSAALLEVAT